MHIKKVEENFPGRGKFGSKFTKKGILDFYL